MASHLSPWPFSFRDEEKRARVCTIAARARPGVPLLILPMHCVLDQAMIGKAVAAAGAGLVLSKMASAEEIRAAVRALLQDPSYRLLPALSALVFVRVTEKAEPRMRSKLC